MPNDPPSQEKPTAPEPPARIVPPPAPDNPYNELAQKLVREAERVARTEPLPTPKPTPMPLPFKTSRG